MATLEKVMNMKKRGMSDGQIIQSLKEEGISPKEIQDSLSQSKIKSSLVNNPETQTNPPGEYDDFQGEQSIMTKGNTGYETEQPPHYEENMAPAPYDTSGPYPQEEPQINPTAYQEYAPQYSDQQYPEYQPPQSLDVETISDIAEQIAEEKNEKLKKQISSFSRFKEETKMNLEKIEQRLARLENTFNELQIAIIRKIGDYGEDIQDISKEMHATQKSFSKILDPLTENITRLKEFSSNENSSPTSPKTQKKSEQSEPEPRKIIKKPKDNFENYLR